MLCRLCCSPSTQLLSVLQVIDTDALTLQNVITFPPDGAFVVQSKIELVGDQRVQFEFVSASLKLPRRVLQLPPYGKGWYAQSHILGYTPLSAIVQ